MAEPKDPIPASMTRQQAADFWDTHSVTDYLDELDPVEGPLDVAINEPVLPVPLSRQDLDALRQAARRRGLASSALAKVWLLDRLRGEGGR